MAYQWVENFHQCGNGCIPKSHYVIDLTFVLIEWGIRCQNNLRAISSTHIRTGILPPTTNTAILIFLELLALPSILSTPDCFLRSKRKACLIFSITESSSSLALIISWYPFCKSRHSLADLHCKASSSFQSIASHKLRPQFLNYYFPIDDHVKLNGL